MCIKKYCVRCFESEESRDKHIACGEAADMHVVAGLVESIKTGAIVASKKGVLIVPVENHSMLGGHNVQIILDTHSSPG